MAMNTFAPAVPIHYLYFINFIYCLIVKSLKVTYKRNRTIKLSVKTIKNNIGGINITDKLKTNQIPAFQGVRLDDPLGVPSKSALL